jgi:hypothetical protein
MSSTPTPTPTDREVAEELWDRLRLTFGLVSAQVRPDPKPAIYEMLGQALAQAREPLAEAIRSHRSQKADDRCIEDDDRLYEALGDGIKCDRRVGSREDMLRNCARFIDRRCESGHWPTYQELEAALERIYDEGIHGCGCVFIVQKVLKDHSRGATYKELEEFIASFADEPCSYGDNCPINSGSRHGTCENCKAREVLKR